ncbi:MAG: hypothetical protein MUC31_09340 [Bacteroidales bacterium]|jgi:hypothetical protein|nr:hypothetical protein [Bacteroidales bacterium]
MTTKAERKALRQENRRLRKALRSEKKAYYEKIKTAAESAHITIDLDTTEPKFADAFNQVWPILRPILEYAELVKITGPEADKVIRAVIDIGGRISTGAASEAEKTEFIQKLDNIWQPVKTVLGIIVTFTNDNVDNVINKIIEIGDWITEERNG